MKKTKGEIAQSVLQNLLNQSDNKSKDQDVASKSSRL